MAQVRMGRPMVNGSEWMGAALNPAGERAGIQQCGRTSSVELKR